MLDVRILLGAVATLAVALLFCRRFRSRTASMELTPVTSAWLAERRRVREDLIA